MEFDTLYDFLALRDFVVSLTDAEVQAIKDVALQEEDGGEESIRLVRGVLDRMSDNRYYDLHNTVRNWKDVVKETEFEIGLYEDLVNGVPE